MITSWQASPRAGEVVDQSVHMRVKAARPMAIAFTHPLHANTNVMCVAMRMAMGWGDSGCPCTLSSISSVAAQSLTLIAS